MKRLLIITALLVLAAAVTACAAPQSAEAPTPFPMPVPAPEPAMPAPSGIPDKSFAPAPSIVAEGEISIDTDRMIVRTANQFESTIQIAKDGEAVDCKSILSLLTLGAAQGTELTLSAEGADAQQALDALGQLFDSGFADPNQVKDTEQVTDTESTVDS